MIRPIAILGAVGSMAASSPAVAQSLPEWRFVEELRIGSENDDLTGFSSIRGLLVDRGGNIWVLERSTQDIRFFDPEGKPLRTIGRKGKGPGEFTNPTGMALAPDGLVWVYDPANSRFSLFDQTGRFVRQQLVQRGGYEFRWSGGFDAAGRIWERVFLPQERDNPASFYLRSPVDFSRGDTLRIPDCRRPGTKPGEEYFELPGPSFMEVPYTARPLVALDFPRGVVWCAPSSAEYRVVRMSIERPDTLARVTGRGMRIPVSPEEHRKAVADVERFVKQVGRGGSADLSRIPKLKPLMERIAVDEAGRLWLQRIVPDGTVAFDGYTAQGKPFATFRVRHPVSRWLTPVVRGNVFWFVAQEEGEIPYVVRGRLVPGR